MILVSLLLAASVAAGAPREAWGPLEGREEWLLAMPVVNLPATPTDALPKGRTELRLDGDWGNDFGWRATPTDVGDPAKPGAPIFFMVDGEHRTAGLRVRRGLGGGWDAAARLTLRWRGPGVLDSIIDPFHDAFGFPNAGRPFFPRNLLRIEGDLEGGGHLDWPGRAGGGLGAPELEVRRAFGGEALRTALVARVSLPLGTGAFSESAAGGGLQLVGTARLAGPLYAHGGAGLAVQGADEVEGVRYARTRVHGYGGLEWRLSARWDLVAQGEIASRLVENLSGHPGLHLYLRAGARFAPNDRWRVEGGFLEGLAALDGTTDFAVQAAIVRRF